MSIVPRPYTELMNKFVTLNSWIKFVICFIWTNMWFIVFFSTIPSDVSSKCPDRISKSWVHYGHFINEDFALMDYTQIKFWAYWREWKFVKFYYNRISLLQILTDSKKINHCNIFQSSFQYSYHNYKISILFY